MTFKKTSEMFLFGAGAVIDWNAPSTPEITDIIRKTGFLMRNSDMKITEFIYQRLIKCGYSEEEINFETIINVIEELIVYNSEFNSKTQTPSLLKSFLNEKELADIYNYSIKGGKREHGYQLQIPDGTDYVYSGYSVWDETPNSFFLEHLINVILSEISIIVSDYAWNTEDYLVNCQQSLNFRKMMKSLDKETIIRLYTLNYDYLFKSLLEEENIDCFDGFEYHSSNNYHYKPDIHRIHSDTISNIHYNLHGSAYWEVANLDENKLQNHEILKTNGIGLQENDTPSTFQMEKGKPIQITNIITGYQKTQKSAMTPFRQFQSSFDRDCLLAKRITIIGYSFNDEHINESLKMALRYNENLLIEIVDPSFIKNNMDYTFALNIFPFIKSKNMNPKKIRENEFVYFDGKVKVFTLKFSKYLEFKRLNNFEH